ncbi:MAG TPA: hypothetical protein VFX80_02395 [Solirubrobacteraceae bacterium]|nr:hypothetical protein [Solirubrobacteraceae bacterium]
MSPASFVRVPPDGTGKKLRTRERVIGADTVHEQFLTLGSDPTWLVRSGPLACAQNKLFLCFRNTASGGYQYEQTLRVRRLYIQNAQLPAIVSGTAPSTVGMMQFDVKRISAYVGGTAVTAAAYDTAEPEEAALSRYTAHHTATSATEGVTLFSWFTNNDEIGLTGAFPQAMYQQCVSSLIDGWELRELVLRPGEGFCVKQITNFTLGAFDVLAVVSRDQIQGGMPP